MNTRTSQWKLRRLAFRVLRILADHAASHGAIASYQQNLKQAAEAFIASYDQVRPLVISRASELAEARMAAQALLKLLRPWAAQVAASGAVPGFQAGELGRSPEVVDDVIADAQSLITVVNQAKASKADLLPFADALVADVGAGLAVADQQWRQGQQARDAYQALTEETQRHGRRLEDLLVGFRRSLASILGRNHPAYQALRSAKIERDVLEPGEEKGLPPELVPAPGDGVEQEKMSA